MLKRKEARSNRATKFSEDLRNALARNERLGTRIGVDTWRSNWRVPRTRETVDVVGLQGRTPKILVEVELRREDPASNVIKIWKWIADGRLSKRIVLFHAFSKVYKGAKEVSKARALFAGQKMKHDYPRVRYMAKDFGYNPEARGRVGGGARRKRAQELAQLIAESLKEIARKQ